MTDRDTAARALERAQAVLDCDPEGDHSPREMTCPACATFWNAVLKSEGAGIPAWQSLANLSLLVPDAPHPSPACTPCVGCRFEVGMAMATVELGRAGVDEDTAWGPGHPPGQGMHPEQPEDCGVCREWLSQRARARQACAQAGVDADRWLGSDDTVDITAIKTR